jgi:hypothetical protein
MPTVQTKTVGSSGRNYSTIAAFWAAVPANLVTADEQWIAELYNDSVFNETLTLSGKTTDATRNIIIRCASGQSFKFNANKGTNALRYNQTNGVAVYSDSTPITISANMNLLIDGLQAKGNGNVIQQTSIGPNVVIRDCLVESAAASTGIGPLVLYGGTAINCLGVNTAGGSGFISNGGSATFHNCTAVQMGVALAFGFRGNYDTPVCTNCASFGFGTAFRAGVTGNYNASDQASPPGANSVASLTYANQFQNVASTGTMDFRLKTGNNLAGAGVRDQTYTTDLDILGQARSTTTPAIGAVETIIAAPPALSSPTGTATGNTTGSGSVSTTGTDGLLWKKPATSAQTDPGAGNEAGAGWTSQAVTGSGTQTVGSLGTLTTNTAYVQNYLHVSAGGLRSSVATSSSFTPATLAIAATALSSQVGAQGTSLAWSGATPESLVTNTGIGAGSWAVTAGAGASGVTGCNASTGVLTAAALGTPGSYTITLTRSDSSTAGSSVPQTVTKTVSLTVNVSGSDTTPPTLTGNVTVSLIGSTTATISFSSGTDNVGITTYDASLDGGTSWFNIGITAGGVQTYGLGSLTPATSYPVRVRARDAAGNVSTPPIQPASGSFTTTSAGVGKFDLSNAALYQFKSNLGFVQASLPVTFFVHDVTTGALVGSAITGLSSNASGVVTSLVTNASMVSGTVYSLKWKFSSGAYGIWEAQAA